MYCANVLRMDGSNSSLAKYLAHAHVARSWQGSSPALWTEPKPRRRLIGSLVEKKRTWKEAAVVNLWHCSCVC